MAHERLSHATAAGSLTALWAITREGHEHACSELPSLSLLSAFGRHGMRVRSRESSRNMRLCVSVVANYALL